MSSKKENADQNLLMTMGIERTIPSIAERIATENTHYAIPVFIPVLAAAVFLAIRYSCLAVWIAFAVQLGTAGYLAYELFRETGKQRDMRVNSAIYWHVFANLSFLVICIAQESNAENLWFLTFISVFTLFGLFAIPPAYTALMLFVQALLLVFVFPDSAFDDISFQRILAILFSLLYLTGVRFYWKSSRIANEEQARAERALMEQTAQTDLLTGVLNRVGGERLIENWMKDHPGQSAMMIVMNLRELKVFNEVYGQETGNMLLISTAREIRSVFGGKGELIRKSGTEFAVFSREPKEEILRLIQEYTAIHHVFSLDEKTYRYEVCVGYVQFPDQAQNMMDMFAQASKAARLASAMGKLCIAYDEAMDREHSASLSFDIRDLAMGIPGAILVYRAHGDEKILFANNELFRIFECEDMRDFMLHVKGSFRTLVHPDDIDAVEKSIWDQINEENDKKLDYVDYRIITKTGKIRNIVDFGKLVHNPHYGDVFYVFLYDAEDKEMTLRQKMME